MLTWAAPFDPWIITLIPKINKVSVAEKVLSVFIFPAEQQCKNAD